ncbi:MAG: hypothetical protein HOW73_41110 [Polyangiaceae bacterium]|nr:hypothetical protein [Polyangiaceae bacterium]
MSTSKTETPKPASPGVNGVSPTTTADGYERPSRPTKALPRPAQRFADDPPEAAPAPAATADQGGAVAPSAPADLAPPSPPAEVAPVPSTAGEALDLPPESHDDEQARKAHGLERVLDNFVDDPRRSAMAARATTTSTRNYQPPKEYPFFKLMIFATGFVTGATFVAAGVGIFGWFQQRPPAKEASNTGVVAAPTQTAELRDVPPPSETTAAATDATSAPATAEPAKTVVTIIKTVTAPSVPVKTAGTATVETAPTVTSAPPPTAATSSKWDPREN